MSERFFIKIFILVIAFSTLSSCLTLTEKARKLNVTENKEAVKECKMSGKVSATGIGQGYHKAMTLLKNNAAKYGDTLLITKDSNGLNSKDLEGEAYVCSNFVETDNKDEKINSLKEVKYIPEGRRVSDLMYVPDQGKFFFDLEFGFSKEMSTWRVDDGRDFLDVETANSEALLTVGYAFTDQLGIGISGNYTLNSSTDQTHLNASTRAGQVDKLNSQGVSDPSFTLFYRAMDLKKGDSFDLNLGFSVSPELLDAEVATTAQDGNGTKGSTNFNFYAQLGQRMEKNSWAIGIGVTSVGEALATDLRTGEITTVDSYVLVDLSLDAQVRINPTLHLGLGGSLSNSGAVTVRTGSTSFNEYEDVPEIEVRGFSIFELSNSLILRGELNLGAIEDRRITTNLSNSFNEVDNVRFGGSISITQEY